MPNQVFAALVTDDVDQTFQFDATSETELDQKIADWCRLHWYSELGAIPGTNTGKIDHFFDCMSKSSFCNSTRTDFSLSRLTPITITQPAEDKIELLVNGNLKCVAVAGDENACQEVMQQVLRWFVRNC
jgi:hypothetical protein